MHRLIALGPVMLLVTLASCESSRPKAPPIEGAAHAAIPRNPQRKRAQMRPEVVVKAEEILREHADDPLGTEVPFEINGKGYLGVIEEHDNLGNDPGRPPGKHKGVTVYEG